MGEQRRRRGAGIALGAVVLTAVGAGIAAVVTGAPAVHDVNATAGAARPARPAATASPAAPRPTEPPPAAQGANDPETALREQAERRAKALAPVPPPTPNRPPVTPSEPPSGAGEEAGAPVFDPDLGDHGVRLADVTPSGTSRAVVMPCRAAGAEVGDCLVLSPAAGGRSAWEVTAPEGRRSLVLRAGLCEGAARAAAITLSVRAGTAAERTSALAAALKDSTIPVTAGETVRVQASAAGAAASACLTSATFR